MYGMFGPLRNEEKDFCISCAVRVNNKLLSFIEEAKKKEAERKAWQRQI